MKDFVPTIVLFLAVGLSIAIPFFPHNSAIDDQNRKDLWGRTQASNDVRPLSGPASSKHSRNLEDLKTFIQKITKRKTTFLGDHDDEVEPKERRNPAGEFPNVGPRPFAVIPNLTLNLTLPPNPFDTGNGPPFPGHGPVAVSISNIASVSSTSTAQNPSSTTPNPPFNSTSGFYRTHHRNGSHHHLTTNGSHWSHRPHATPVPGNLIPPPSLTIPSFMTFYKTLAQNLSSLLTRLPLHRG